MSKEGERHAAELIRLEGKRKELEDALGRLARDEAEAQEVMELASHVQQLEQEVESARAAADMEKDMTKEPMTKADVAKAAAGVMAKVDKQLDALAKTMRADGETFEAAYVRALDSDMGRSMLKTRDDAHALATGAPTACEVNKARAALMGGN
jgi:DNA repair exonuclease SbcCD ATPase subunit